MSPGRTLTWAILSTLVLGVAYPAPLAALDCPPLVYVNEVFVCRVQLYSLFDSTEIQYSVSSGGKLVTADSQGTLSIRPGQMWEKEVNVWALEGGSDVFTFEYGSDEEKQAHSVTIRIVEPPLRVSLPDVQLLPGKAGTAKIKLKGRASGVSLRFSYPPTLTGRTVLDAGDVAGEKLVKVEISADPFAVGTYPVDVYVTFFDRYGAHTLRFQMNVEVGIPPTAWLTLVAMLLVLGAGYSLWRRRKKAQAS